MAAITVASARYIEANFGTKTPEEFAKDTGMSVRSVKSYLAILAANGFEPPKPAETPSLAAHAGFAVHKAEDSSSATVSMTQGASEKADEARKAKNGRNEQFFQKRAGGVHIIDQTKPIQ